MKKISVTKRVNRESGCYDSSITLGLIGLGVVGLLAVGKHDNDLKGAFKEAHEVERIAKNGIPNFMKEVEKKTLDVSDADKIDEYACEAVAKAEKLSPNGKPFMREYYRFKAEMIQATRSNKLISLENEGGMPYMSPVELFDKMYIWCLKERIDFPKTSALFCEDVSDTRASTLKAATEEFRILNDAICSVLFCKEEGHDKQEREATEAFIACKHVPVLKELKPYGYKEGEDATCFMTWGDNKINKNWVQDAQTRSEANKIYEETLRDLTKTDGGLIEIINTRAFDLLTDAAITDSAELLNKFKDIKQYALDQLNSKKE